MKCIMRIKIVGMKIYLPKGVREKIGMRDEYELIIIGDEINIKV